MAKENPEVENEKIARPRPSPKRKARPLNQAAAQKDTRIPDAAFQKKRRAQKKNSDRQFDQETASKADINSLEQLFLLQEQVEYYFLKSKASLRQVEGLKKQIEKLLSRDIDYAEWSEVRVVEGSDAKSIGLIFRNFETATSSIETLEIGAAFADLNLTISIKNNPLALKPNHMSAQDVFVINPLDDPFLEQVVLSPLNPDQWAFIRILPAALKDALASKDILTINQLRAIKNFRHWLHHPQSWWRCDKIELLTETVDGAYEHLWIKIRNASHGDMQWPFYEFRLAVADVRKNQFSRLPRLEFPRQHPQQLDNWYCESIDRFGEKYELRFDTTTGDIDLAAWDPLTAADKLRIISLIKQIPSWLLFLEKSGAQISRGWGQWTAIPDKLLDIILKHAIEKGIV